MSAFRFLSCIVKAGSSLCRFGLVGAGSSSAFRFLETGISTASNFNLFGCKLISVVASNLNRLGMGLESSSSGPRFLLSGSKTGGGGGGGGSGPTVL